MKSKGSDMLSDELIKTRDEYKLFKKKEKESRRKRK